jgi:enediyne biosynthesis protein E4
MKCIFSFLLVIMFISACTGSEKKIFKQLNGQETGIDFNNLIAESDSINILDVEYMYNGGGVGMGDFNNDGLTDLFFTGNMVADKMYLNEGKMHFRDVSKIAKIEGDGKWCTGVTVADINNDGLMDVYVCASVKKKPVERANILYINKGIGKDGIPVFDDEAGEYNIADTGHSTSAAFFDYDNDGDLDLYILTNKMDNGHFPNQYRKKITDGSAENTDRLYRNDWNAKLGHAVFTNVSKKAGILIEGYGLGLNITDINKDGWKDIYVTNDFLTNDLLWINNHDGTFKNMAGQYFKHTSYSAMGNDVADINNDGLVDVIAVDMLPQYNYRKKMMTAANNYQTYLNNDEFNYEYQYGHNTLQLNQGFAVKNKDSLSHPVFSDIAFLAGVAETDWSWTPMVTDFDNDGLRDIIITNGYPKDITDRDFMTYRAEANKIASKKDMLEQIPEVKLHNFAFKNNGDCTFSDVSLKWGLMEPSFSSGSAYADLDNDGDLDFVVNNTNGEAMVYKNEASYPQESNNHYLQIKFQGDSLNRDGIGTWAEIYYDNGKLQVYENTPYRGYLSSIQNMAHFGLGQNKLIDSVVIKWPGGSMQVITNVKANQLLKVNYINATIPYYFEQKIFASSPLFTDITDSINIPYRQQELDFSDFNIQKLLPHKLSEYGPGLAVGDIDGNGLDDIAIGGSYSYSAKILLQQLNGKFTTQDLIPGADKNSKRWEDMGMLLFDADGDGDLDLYTASGSYENEPNSVFYEDKLFVNDGEGNFLNDSTALPDNFTSKSCVRAVDFDRDGDLDIFIAGRVEPWRYPKPVSSYIYRNDSKAGQIKFTDVTNIIAKDLINIGLVCDAVWTDFDNDGWQDIILAGEWMPIIFLKNDKGIFKNVSMSTGISDEVALWNSIAPADYDNDGDIDYIIGDMGQNSFYRASVEYPVRIYGKDFDNNQSFDAIPSQYLMDNEGNKKEFPAQTRDDIIKQIISMRTKFQNYKQFANATMDQVLTKDELKDALVVQANNFKTSYIKNNGNGKFEIMALPVQAQVSTINGMVTDDFNGDGNVDVAVNGNDFGTEVSVGRYDALNGLLMLGDGKGNFKPQSIIESGIYIPGNGKSLVKLKSENGKYILAASQNRGNLKIFTLRKSQKCVQVLADDVSAIVKYKNGKVRKEEIYYGTSFLSQSGRFLCADENIINIEVTNSQGISRKLSF